jgi:hypothetical protein
MGTSAVPSPDGTAASNAGWLTTLMDAAASALRRHAPDVDI